MADARQFADLRFGHVGRLTYLPREDRSAGLPGALHTTRLLSNEPCFGQTGSSAELYPASRTGPPEPTHAHVWAERNLQTRWLLKAHAEAFMGNSELTGLLRSEDERFRKLDDDGGSSSTGPLLAVGEMLNLSNVRRPTVAPVLAAATGESGELLRLVRIEDTRWGWDDAGGTRLHLSVVDPVDHEDQVLWASDGLPISQIKFAAGPAVRWLLVQKPTSTAILFPEYNKVPRYESRSYGDDSGQQPMLSRINPMPLLTLSHRNTGGNAHSDVAFNPPADDRMPQLAVVDECGYWTLWNVVAYSRADRKKLRLALSRCGHIFEGALPVIPGQSAWPAEKHGVLFAGTRGAADPLFQDDFFHDLDDAHKTAQRSTHLVLWNSERFVVVDIESGDALPSMADFSTAKSRFGRILDVRLDPLDQNRVFVLTARFVVWVDVVVPAQPEAPPKSSLITSCPHRMEHSDGLRMFVGPSTTDAEGAVPMVFVSSSSDHQVGVHWFNVDPRNRLAQWHSRLALVMQSPEQGEGSGSKPFAPRELAFYPCKFASTAPASGAGFRYRQAGVQFYQGMALGQDLSVRYCMCFAATGPKMDVVPPTVRIGWTQKQQDRRRKKKRSQMLSFMGETVVVPDSMTDKVIRSLENRRPTTVDETRGDDVVDEGASNPVYLKIPLVFEAIKQRLYGDQEPSAGLPRAYLDLLRDVVHERFLGEPVPFMTWQDIISDGDADNLSDVVPEEEVATPVEEMLLGADEQTTMVQLTRRRNGDAPKHVGDLSQLRRQLRSLWLDPLRDKLSERETLSREVWLSNLARALFLSMHGVAVQTVMANPLFGTAAQQSQSQPDPEPRTPIQSSQTMPPSSSLPSSPPASSARSSMEPSSQAADGAVERLQLLCPGGIPSPPKTTKRPTVLAYWPTARGVDPMTAGYVSSVAVAADRKLDGARMRHQRVEAKRKALAERYASVKRTPRAGTGLPPSSPGLPAGGGGGGLPQIMSSQREVQPPPSSQILAAPPIISMSQPAPGAFGDRKRKKAKKEKKRSGFR